MAGREVEGRLHGLRDQREGNLLLQSEAVLPPFVSFTSASDVSSESSSISSVDMLADDTMRRRIDSRGKNALYGNMTGGKMVHFDDHSAFTFKHLMGACVEVLVEGTYWTVYKANLGDGDVVAFKMLNREVSTQSEIQKWEALHQFEYEINVLGKIQHPNLIALRAVYFLPLRGKLLMFDYMPRGNLSNFLHARKYPHTMIDWPTRMNIATGITRGLHYLHTHKNMVHGNLTGRNILLDEDINAKITDFGLSCLTSNTMNSNIIAMNGVLGYHAPELSKLKKATTMADVFSIGVILLELLTGKSPMEKINGLDLQQWVISTKKAGKIDEAFDTDLMRDVMRTTKDELLNILNMALRCVRRRRPSSRPGLLKVLQQLEKITTKYVRAPSATTTKVVDKPIDEGASSASMMATTAPITYDCLKGLPSYKGGEKSLVLIVN